MKQLGCSLKFPRSDPKWRMLIQIVRLPGGRKIAHYISSSSSLFIIWQTCTKPLSQWSACPPCPVVITYNRAPRTTRLGVIARFANWPGDAALIDLSLSLLFFPPAPSSFQLRAAMEISAPVMPFDGRYWLLAVLSFFLRMQHKSLRRAELCVCYLVITSRSGEEPCLVPR